MAADLWQLVNGWELVDWSLNVGDETPTPPGTGGTRRTMIPRQPRTTYQVRPDDDAVTLALLLLL